MDRRRKWKYRALAGLQVLAAAAIAGAVIYLLYRYIQYGERSARETGASRLPAAEVSETAEAGNDGTENSGTAEQTGTAESAETVKQTGTEDETGAEDVLNLPGDGKTEAGAAGEESPGTEDAQTAAEGNGSLPGTVRVRILTDDFVGEYHDRLELTSEKTFIVRLDGKRIRKGKTYRISTSELKEGQVLQISRKDGGLLTVESLTRADGHPQYAGTLWLYREADGLVLVNELPLEEYLCGVVSSEMPSDYPEEAQKAQAVCARTYAYNCIRNARAGNSDSGESRRGDTSEIAAEDKDTSGNEAEDISGTVAGGMTEDTGDTQGDPKERIAADLDDSVNYQVYNNYRATAQSRQAVEATAGEVLPLDEILYYSTSCLSEHREDLDSDGAFRAFLMQEPDAGAEYDSPWLRWETEIPAQDILQELAAGYGLQADRIDEIRVTERAGNGQAQELKLRCGDSEKKIEGEYSIRKLLSAAQTTVRLRDGEEHSGMRLLPSAFFWMETVRAQEVDEQQESGGQRESDGAQKTESGMSTEVGGEEALPIDKVVIHGGGYGHGSGMSQCGAAAMAKKGLDYRQILEYYYSCEPSD